ncbi:MAG: hypothetical protein QG620_597 [Patescibacteria group bacterium]|nr:hypothetical protein [Patescibacteria group bacterium]
MDMRTKTKQKGFTLVELVIAIAIMTVIFLTAFFAYQQNRATAKLEAAQREVASAIKQAQSYALQGRTQSISGSYQAPVEYGFRFNTDSRYIVFYRIEGDDTPRIAEGPTDLPGGVKLFDPTGDNTEIMAATEITFDVPHGNMFGGEKTFQFQFGENDSRSIVVNEGGMIKEY